MKVAVIQMSCKTYDKAANFATAAPLIEKACSDGAELIALPELFNTGYLSVENEWEYAEAFGGETEQFLRKYAEKYNTAFIAGFSERSAISGLNYNSLLFVAKDKPADSYRKMYLWGPEKNRFIKGHELKLWECGAATVSPQICYEVGFSENAKISALNGAEILCCCSAFSALRFFAWDISTRARALETGCYVLASNHSEAEGENVFCAHSRIVDPKGNILCEATKPNEVIMADIDLSLIYKQRNDLPYLRDIDTVFTAEQYRKINK